MPVTKSLATAGAAITPDDIIARLEQAGATLIALRLGVGPAGYRSAMPEPVRDVGVSYGWSQAKARPAVPSAAAITAMDEALAWVGYIPADRFVLKRIINARALVSPSTGKHLYGWSAIARLIGADRKAVQRWYQQGIALIAAGLSAGPAPRPQSERAVRTRSAQRPRTWSREPAPRAAAA
jgi:hypothetical protein